jgi:hypothetical protein
MSSTREEENTVRENLNQIRNRVAKVSQEVGLAKEVFRFLLSINCVEGVAFFSLFGTGSLSCCQQNQAGLDGPSLLRCWPTTLW